MDWLWFGCFAVAAVFLILAVKNMLFSSGKTVFRIVEVALYLGAAALLLYAPIFFLQQNPLTAATANLINILRIISLDAGYLDHADFIEQHTGTGLFNRLYMAVLGLVHLTMPLISVLALYRVLFRFYSNAMLWLVDLFGRKTFYIFSEINPGTVRLANDIRVNGKKGSLIFANASDSEEKQEAEKLGNAILHPDKGQNIQLFRKKKRELYYFFMSEDENANITDALDLLGSLEGIGEETRKRIHVFVETESDEAEILLDSGRKSAVDVNLLKPEEVAVYRLLEEYPLYKGAKEGVISVLVIGLDSMGTAVVRAASWCGQLSGYRLKINVAGIGIGEQIKEFRDSYPGLTESGCLELKFYDCSGTEELFDTIEKYCRDTTYAVVTAETDMQAAETAIRLRRELCRLDGTYTNKPEIHVHIRNEDQARSINALKTSGRCEENSFSYELDSFGCIDRIFTWENILDSDYELLAGNVHMAYESIAGGENLSTEGMMESYHRLEVYKRESRAFAMHIRYKLAQLGLDYVRETAEEEADFDAVLTGGKLEELTKEEHDRWRMFLFSEGWRAAQPSDVKAYENSGRGADAHKCPLLRMHPYLCTYEEMQQVSKALGLEKTSVSDRELVQKIPEILHDCRGLSEVRYRIVRSR